MFEASEKLKDLGEQIISEKDDLLLLYNENIRIAYLFSDKEKKSHGKYVYADTEKVSDKVKALLPYDFIITFYRPNCESLSDETMQKLMHHELKHVGYDPDRQYYFIVPHDIEDFKDIIQEYGMNWIL